MSLFYRPIFLGLFTLIVCCLSVQAAPPAMVLQSGHLGRVLTVAFSPDGKTLASGSMDGTIRLWNIQRGETLAILSHGGNIRSIAFARGGNLLASAGDDATVKLWSLSSGTLLRTLNGHKAVVKSVAFSPDGKTLASGSHDATARLWDVQSGRLKRVFSDPQQRAGQVEAVTFSPDGKRLAIGAANYNWGLTLVWDIASVRLQHSLSAYKARASSTAEQENNSVVFSPNGKLLATATQGGVVKMWDAHTGKLRYSFSDVNEKASGSVTMQQVVFSPDSRTLIGTSVEGTIKLWNADTGKLVRRIDGQRYSEINSVAISPNGRIIAASHANNVELALAGNGTRFKQLAGNQAFAVTELAFSGSGELLASGGEGQPLSLWNAQRGTLQRIFRSGSSLRSNINALALAPDESLLARSAGDSVRLENIATGKLVRVLPDMRWVYDLDWSPDGKLLAVATGAGQNGIQLWDVETWRRLEILASGEQYVSVSFSPDGKLLAGGDGDSVRVWNIADRTLVQTLAIKQNNISGLTFSPDGKRILCGVGSMISSLELWNLEMGKREHVFPAGAHGVFSPDGKVVAGAVYNKEGKGIIHLWETQSGALRQSLKDQSGLVTALQFHPAGRMLVAGTQDGKIIFWDTKANRPLATLLSLVRVHNAETGVQSAMHDWIAFTPEGYYTGSSGCEKYIRWRAGSALLPAAKYSAQYRQPDAMERVLTRAKF